MNWDDLKYALALHRAGTLSGAADELGVVRTTVGRRVRGLEEALGVRLFDQTPDGFAATPAGGELVEAAARLEEQVLLAKGRVLGRDADLEGPLRVSTLGFVYEGFMDVFTSFMGRYPGVEVTLLVGMREVSLVRREADVVVRLSNTPGDRLVGRRLGTMEFAPYARRELVARRGAQDVPWIVGDERGDRWLEGWLEAHAPGAQVAMRVEDYAALRASIRRGIGASFLPCFEALDDPELVCVGPRLDAEARGLWALTLPELRTNSRVRAFMDHAYEAFARQRGRLAGRAPGQSPV
jgi:DNA-binding transcriptional LysR family regulator